jgi:osmotically-inducible protein OsmY
MKTDVQLQKDVMEELKWEPYLQSSEIGVAVKNGVVTLSGLVDTYSKKLQAEKAAKRVKGVKAIAEDIEVRLSFSPKKSDTEIADAVMNALKWNTAVREEKIKVSVEDGTVKLEGEVDWDYERRTAKQAISQLTGVQRVINLITLKPRVSVQDLRGRISNALHRNAAIDAAKIMVEVLGNKVVLRGEVRSMMERDEAESAAWNAPGVERVENKITIEIPEYAFED